MSLIPSRLSAVAVLLAMAAVCVVGVVAYFPAIDNSFISDDFTMLPFVRVLEAHPAAITTIPSEIFRSTSYVYFWACLKAFGPVPEPFYWTGIALHVLISLLVGKLVLGLTQDPLSAWTAALFFAAYERHHEAVMWISGVNDAVLTLFCLVFLILWDRSWTSQKRGWIGGAASVALVIALFSKEASVAMVPLALVLGVVKGYSWRESLRRIAPLSVLLAAYVVLWLSQASRNFFVADGHYALTFSAIPVFAKSFMRVLSPGLLFLAPLVLWGYRRSRLAEVRDVLKNRVTLFFVAAIALTIVPYSFLTYLNHIPSRNTYLPSVGLAALVGILFASFYQALDSPRLRMLSAGFLVVVIAGNISYLWLKKDSQFEGRAAPTRELIANLNDSDFRVGASAPIYICGFPLHVSIAQSAVDGFTPFHRDDLVFREHCDKEVLVNVLDWSASEERYSRRIASADQNTGKEEGRPE